MKLKNLHMLDILNDAGFTYCDNRPWVDSFFICDKQYSESSIAFYHESENRLNIFYKYNNQDFELEEKIFIPRLIEVFKTQNIKHLYLNRFDSLNSYLPDWTKLPHLEQIGISGNIRSNNFDLLFDMNLKQISLPTLRDIHVDISNIKLYCSITGCFLRLIDR